MLSDRDALIAVFNAVTALAERMTGERMTIAVETEGGQTVWISGGNARWSVVKEAAAAKHSDVLQEPAPTLR